MPLVALKAMRLGTRNVDFGEEVPEAEEWSDHVKQVHLQGGFLQYVSSEDAAVMQAQAKARREADEKARIARDQSKAKIRAEQARLRAEELKEQADLAAKEADIASKEFAELAFDFAKEPVEEAKEEIFEVVDQVAEEVAESEAKSFADLAELPIWDLRKLAKDSGIETGRNWDKSQLIEAIAKKL